MATIRYRKSNPNPTNKRCPITGERDEDGIVIHGREFEDQTAYFIGREGVLHIVAKLYKIDVEEARDALDGYDVARGLHQELWDAEDTRKKQIQEAREKVERIFADIA